MPKGNNSTQMYEVWAWATSPDLVYKYLGLKATNTAVTPAAAIEAVNNGLRVRVKASDMAELKRKWAELAQTQEA